MAATGQAVTRRDAAPCHCLSACQRTGWQACRAAGAGAPVPQRTRPPCMPSVKVACVWGKQANKSRPSRGKSVRPHARPPRPAPCCLQTRPWRRCLAPSTCRCTCASPTRWPCTCTQRRSDTSECMANGVCCSKAPCTAASWCGHSMHGCCVVHAMQAAARAAAHSANLPTCVHRTTHRPA